MKKKNHISKLPTEKLFLKLDEKKERWLKAIASSREMILANLAMISQVPALTFQESERSELIVNRFSEAGISEPTADSIHNAYGYLLSKSPEKPIVIFTHMDNRFEYPIDQSITITENRVYGAGVAIDNIALAVLMTLPDIIRKANIRLNRNVLFLATTRSHGRGDFGGIRHFVNKHGKEVECAINLMNGTNLGMIDYFTLSRVRCDIKCEQNLALEKAWMESMSDSSIMVLNEIITALYGINLPRKPKTILNIGSINGGEGYSTVSREAVARIEALSEDDSIMERLIDEIGVHCTDIGARHGMAVSPDFFGRHRAAGLTSAHPLVKTTMEIIKRLDLQPEIQYSNTEITVMLAESIPSVGIGVTTGMSSGSKSYVDIEPVSLGVLQILQLLYSIDREFGKNE